MNASLLFPALYGGGSYTEYIYTGNIPDLSAVRLSTEALVFGANVSISRLMDQLSFAAQNLVGFSYVSHLVETWKYLGNTSVRNVSGRIFAALCWKFYAIYSFKLCYIVKPGLQCYLV